MIQEKKYLMLFPVILLALTFIISGKYMIADIYKEKTLYKLNQWEKYESQINLNSWNQTEKNISKAILLDPDNPGYYLIMGHIEQWKVKLISNKQEQAKQFRQALSYYHKTTLMRPTWPYAWSNMFIVMAKLGEIDNDFWFAVDNSIKMGEWEEDIHLDVVDVGLNIWNDINLARRKVIINSIYIAAQTNPVELFAILKKYNQEKLICFKKENKLVRDMCSKNNL